MQAMLIFTFTSTNIVVLKVEFKRKHLVKERNSLFFNFFFFLENLKSFIVLSEYYFRTYNQRRGF